MKELTTTWAFQQWEATAAPWERAVYHSGLLMRDRDADATGKQSHPINDIANAAMDLCRKGRVLLFQKRLAPGHCQYIAVKVPKVLPVAVHRLIDGALA